jgi:hypothetical protein
LFYAVCPIHKWTVKFYDGDSEFETMLVEHNTSITGPTTAPWRDDSNLPLDQTYALLGYNRSKTATTPMDLENFRIINDTTFYTVWNDEPISVYDNIHPEYFEIVNENYTSTNSIHGNL